MECNKFKQGGTKPRDHSGPCNGDEAKGEPMTAAELRAKYKPPYTLEYVLQFCDQRSQDSQTVWFDPARWSSDLTAALCGRGFTVGPDSANDGKIMVSWKEGAEHA